MDLPKRARTADWEKGVLTLDGDKKIDVPELTLEIMERLSQYALVGFHVKDYPITDEMLIPFTAHKNMVNFGVENGALTDACFSVFSAMPKLRYLLLDGNQGIDGSGLSVLQDCKLDLLTLNRTGLNDDGLLIVAAIPKLTHLQLDYTAVTFEGLLAITDNSRIEPVSHEQFTKAQMEKFTQLQREKAKKPVVLNEQAAEECRKVLSAFFEEMPKAFTSFCAVDTEQLLPSSSLLIVDLSTLLFAANSLIDHPFFVISSFNIATFISIKSPPS